MEDTLDILKVVESYLLSNHNKMKLKENYFNNITKN